MGFEYSDEFEDNFRRFMAEARKLEERATRAMKEFEERENCVVPLHEMRPTSNGYLITLDLPGVEKEEVTLTFRGAALIVTAPCRSLRVRRCGGTPHYFVELPLPPGIDESTIKAKMRNGLLTVEMKRVEGGHQIRIE